MKSWKIAMLGLTITSSWGNGHATTFRGLMKALAKRGHEVLFFERDVPWYAQNRDLPDPPYGMTYLYSSVEELQQKYRGPILDADFILLGSYVPDGIQIGNWILENATHGVSFYDMDTPITVSKVERHECEYISSEQIPKFDLYLTFTSGPILQTLRSKFGAKDVRPLFCSVDPEAYFPQRVEFAWDLGYMGTYSSDRQPQLETLMFRAAEGRPMKKMIVAGPKYPDHLRWPQNVEHVDHIAPPQHCNFYNLQKFTLNVTRSNMVQAGYSPSVRLFEAAACATPIISDYWQGLEEFFEPGSEILTASKTNDVEEYLDDLDETEREAIGRKGRQKTLLHHTAFHRAQEIETYIGQLR